MTLTLPERTIITPGVDPSVAEAAFAECLDVWGPGAGDTKHQHVMDHEARVATYGQWVGHLVGDPELGRGLARGGAAHDEGKRYLALPGGVWTQEYRREMRNRHTLLGSIHLLRQPRLQDRGVLATIAQHHHHRTNDPRITILQALDRFDALTTRAYVLEREGELSVPKLLDLVFQADTATEVHALPETVRIGSRAIDLRGIVGCLATAALAQRASTLDC